MFSTKPGITTFTIYNLDSDSAQAVKHHIYQISHAYQDLEKDELTHAGKWQHLILHKQLECIHCDGKDEDRFLCLLAWINVSLKMKTGPYISGLLSLCDGKDEGQVPTSLP